LIDAFGGGRSLTVAVEFSVTVRAFRHAGGTRRHLAAAHRDTAPAPNAALGIIDTAVMKLSATVRVGEGPKRINTMAMW